VSTWLFAIARYKALSARRRRRDDPLDDRLVNSICDPSKDAETMLQEKDRDEALVVALNKLSDEHHGKDTNVLRAQETRPSARVQNLSRLRLSGAPLWHPVDMQRPALVLPAPGGPIVPVPSWQSLHLQ
jgi:hypothetical protein